MKKQIRNIFFLIFMVGLPAFLQAQDQPVYNEYQYNQMVFNPAYTGSRHAIETSFFLHRQSVSLPGAPSTESFVVHAPVSNDKVGLGMKIYHDNIGVTNSTFFGLDYAYRAHVSANLVASFGLEASITNFSVNYTLLDGYTDGDPAFTVNTDDFWKPNFSAGFYLESNHYYFGLSSVSLLGSDQTAVTITDSVYDAHFDQVSHLFITGGALLKAGDQFSLKPNFLFKSAPEVPAQLDINLDFVFYNTLIAGVGYRTNNSMSFMAQYFLSANNTLNSNEVGFGYSFNTQLGEDKPYLGPSHEVFIVYRFNQHNTSIKNPRFF